MAEIRLMVPASLVERLERRRKDLGLSSSFDMLVTQILENWTHEKLF